MAKLVTILPLVFILFGCKTEVIKVPKYLDKDLTFLQGTWEWRKSSYSFSTTTATLPPPTPNTVAYGLKKRFIYSDNANVYATLIFSDRKVEISSSSGDTTMRLNLSGYTEVQGKKIITFRNGENEVIRLLYVPELNTIETEHLFFVFDKGACNTAFHILTNTYEKI